MKYRLTFLLAFLSVLYERAWSSFWPALSILAAYAALSLMNVVEMFGPRAHAGLLLLAACALVRALARPFKFPSASDVERRIEAESALRHRPLAALHDRPAGHSGPDALALWDLHLRRMAALKENLRVPRPRPDTARQDRYALRHAALILLVIGFAAAGSDAGGRLLRGLKPAVTLDLARKQAAVDAWITPPDYTRLPPVFLAASQPGIAVARGAVEVPANSVLKIRVDGSARAPRLRFAGRPHAFTRASRDSWILALPLAENGMLRVRQGVNDLGAWQVALMDDAPPEIAVTGTAPAARGALKITYRAADDYGIASLTGTVAPPETLPPEKGGRIATFDMPAAAPPRQENKDGEKPDSSFTIDLSSSLRAGQPALLTLTATDGAGHLVSTAPFPFVLPERAFTNALARKIVAARKTLVAAGDDLSRRAVAATLADLGQNPALYNGDIKVFMALGSAVRRLMYDSTPESVMSVEDLLWDVALKLEDGGLTVASRDLSEALQKLSQALADKTMPKEEVQKLLDDAQRKMQAWLRSLMTDLAQRLQDGKHTTAMPPEMAQKFMKNIDLGEMLREMQQLAQSGSREDMQKMAEMLKDAVDNLDMGKLGEASPEQMEAMKALEDMQEIIRRQQSLMDKTSRLDPADKDAAGKKEQDALREKLGDVVRKLGDAMQDPPENLAAADQAMKKSQNAFKDGKPRDSVPHQKEALSQLEKGMDSAVKAMAKKMQRMLSLGFSPGQGRNYGEGFDPLGRGDKDGSGQGGDLKLPDAAERRRVQEIIEELRSRSNEYQRPKVERDYLDRLLDQMN